MRLCVHVYARARSLMAPRLVFSSHHHPCKDKDKDKVLVCQSKCNLPDDTELVGVRQDQEIRPLISVLAQHSNVCG